MGGVDGVVGGQCTKTGFALAEGAQQGLSRVSAMHLQYSPRRQATVADTMATTHPTKQKHLPSLLRCNASWWNPERG